jgi:hypothetical protein
MANASASGVARLIVSVFRNNSQYSLGSKEVVYAYDEMDRMTEKIAPEGKIQYSYDEAGNLKN